VPVLGQQVEGQHRPDDGQAGLGADSGTDAEEEGEEGGAALESTGEKIVDPRLDVFRDFVNSLDAEPGAGGERREGPSGG